jgi:hypothetical protein
MWTFRREELPHRTLRFALDSPYREVLRLWRTDRAFRTTFNALLADAPYRAFRWETPPITKANADRPFEFVLIDSPGLAREPEPDAFAAHFAKDAQAVIEFPNLGRDAILIVPRPLEAHSAYGHLAAFVRHAPLAQSDMLWEQVGAAMERRLGTSPVWLSTAGAGVSWLHVRLDDRPKYYGHASYRKPPS